jgi:SpoVK/Ycf46/Vps4 family AAA+-type ATPase
MNRPSRFDEIIKIGMPSAAARKVFIQAKVPRLNDAEAEAELTQWVKGTEELSVAHIREVIISVECLGNELDRTIKRLRKMNNITVKSTDADTKQGIGFAPSKSPEDEDHDFS